MKIIVKIFISFVLMSAFACTKEIKYQYDVNDVSVKQQGGEKNNRKSTTEFISIAYADLFGSNIPSSKLSNLSFAYASFDVFGTSRLLLWTVVDPISWTTGLVSLTGILAT